jgi:hypothetical protein
MKKISIGDYRCDGCFEHMLILIDLGGTYKPSSQFLEDKIISTDQELSTINGLKKVNKGYRTRCGHFFCKNCIGKFTVCPKCEKGISKWQDYYYYKDIEDLCFSIVDYKSHNDKNFIKRKRNALSDFIVNLLSKNKIEFIEVKNKNKLILSLYLNFDNMTDILNNRYFFIRDNAGITVTKFVLGPDETLVDKPIWMFRGISDIKSLGYCFHGLKFNVVDFKDMLFQAGSINLGELIDSNKTLPKEGLKKDR